MHKFFKFFKRPIRIWVQVYDNCDDRQGDLQRLTYSEWMDLRRKLPQGWRACEVLV